MLKKEFNRKDVERMRNLIRGKANESAEIQVGYKKKRKEYKEGDVWTEGKKTWTIKNGIKKTVSKLSSVRKEIFIPLCCPKCSKVMRHHLDKSNYRLHKKCLDCVVAFEGSLKNKGKYKEYIKNLTKKNSIDIIEDVENYLLDVANNSNEGYVSEDGVIERWIGGVNKKEMSKEIKESAQMRRKHIKNNE